MAHVWARRAITASIVAAPDTLANVAANQMTFTAGAVVMLLNSAAVVGIGVMWFPILKRHSEPVALSYLATRTLEAVFLTVGVISLLSLTGLGAAVPRTTLCVVLSSRHNCSALANTL
jgi:hypothetical protein